MYYYPAGSRQDGATPHTFVKQQERNWNNNCTVVTQQSAPIPDLNILDLDLGLFHDFMVE
jgi:hypothetical protein